MQQGITEPVLTWNLFVTMFIVPLCVSLLYYSIKRLFEKKDKERERKDEQIAALIKQRAIEREEALSEWRGRFQQTQCDIKKRLEQIVEGMHDKVDYDHCARVSGHLEVRMHDCELREKQ